MTAKQMIYHFRLKTEKLNSRTKKSFLNEEINVLLNIAQMSLVKSIGQPRYKQQMSNMLGFEGNQRSIEDLRNIVVPNKELKGSVFNKKSFAFQLPADYLFYTSFNATIKQGMCEKPAEVFVVQHDDRTETSSFDRSDFLWGEVNITFFEKNRIQAFVNDFDITQFFLDYVRRPLKIAYVESEYTDIDGEFLKASQDCELSEIIHEDIVDFACFLASDATGDSDYTNKLKSLEINGLT